MKSDQEFLAGIWNRVASLEEEELEKASARRRNHTLRVRRIFALAGTLLGIVLAYMLYDAGFRVPSDGIWQYALAGLFLLAAYGADTRSAKRDGKGLTDR